jgi:hypothetical protein
VSTTSRSAWERSAGKFAGVELLVCAKKALYAPGAEEEKAKSALFPAAIGNGLAGRGERAAIASGEKNANAALPSEVENETVSPLTTGTESALGTRIPSLSMSVISVCAMTRN